MPKGTVITVARHEVVKVRANRVAIGTSLGVFIRQGTSIELRHAPLKGRRMVDLQA